MKKWIAIGLILVGGYVGLRWLANHLLDEESDI